MGSLAKGSLRKFQRKFRGKLQNIVLLCQEECRNSAESFQKFCGNFQTNFYNDSFPNDPISELLGREWVPYHSPKHTNWSEMDTHAIPQIIQEIGRQGAFKPFGWLS